MEKKITISVSDVEYEKIKKIAEGRDMSLEEYCKQVCLFEEMTEDVVIYVKSKTKELLECYKKYNISASDEIKNLLPDEVMEIVSDFKFIDLYYQNIFQQLEKSYTSTINKMREAEDFLILQEFRDDKREIYNFKLWMAFLYSIPERSADPGINTSKYAYALKVIKDLQKYDA